MSAAQPAFAHPLSIKTEEKPPAKNEAANGNDLTPTIYCLDPEAIQNKASTEAAPTKNSMNNAPERAPSSTITPEQHELILSMLPLVKTVVGRIAINLPSHISQEDLLSAGVMGLMDAVRRFDASKGCGIKSYVAIRVRGAVLDELRSMDWAPRSVHRQARDFRKVQEALEQRLGREASESELAQEMKMSAEEFDRFAESIRPTSFISLQDARSHDPFQDDLSHEECIADPNGVSPLGDSLTKEHHTMIEKSIGLLNPIEQKVLALYYYEGLRLKEIAEVLQVTESRVSQIHTLAVQRLRGKLESAQNE
jgi:RNA polymerase sigma factor for flagellar operon FliA